MKDTEASVLVKIVLQLIESILNKDHVLYTGNYTGKNPKNYIKNKLKHKENGRYWNSRFGYKSVQKRGQKVKKNRNCCKICQI